LGEEKHHKVIARVLKQQEQLGQLESTRDIAGICRTVYSKAERSKRPKNRSTKGKAGTEGGKTGFGTSINPATRVLQALRIGVNRELEQLDAVLDAIPSAVSKDGCLVAIITFHSLEDRRVKRALRLWADNGLAQLCGGGVRGQKIVAPSKIEVASNPRARSAKLRLCRFLPHEQQRKH